MIRWVVTGPAGAGKSRFTAALAATGAQILDGDRLGHEILARSEILAAVAREFGPRTVADGAVDRAELGRLVFADPEALARLNRLTHADLAALMDERLDALAETGCTLAVLEAAVYFLLPTPPRADLVVAVVASAATRARRLVEAGLATDDAARRVAAQAVMEDDWPRADVVVVNEGSPAELTAAARRVLREHGPHERLEE